jgi:hypothetical protein
MNPQHAILKAIQLAVYACNPFFDGRHPAFEILNVVGQTI